MSTARKLLYSGFFKLWRIKRDGHIREFIETRNSAALLIHIPEIDSLVFIEQSREAMHEAKNPDGLILEVPAGIFDGKFTPQELMAKEALEEAGAHIAATNIRLINDGMPLATTPGSSTEKKYFGYTEISMEQLDQKKDGFGLANEGEQIKRLIIPVDLAAIMNFQDLAAWALVQWFLQKEGRQ